eukprot:TRINITY_DN2274_c0_g1_i8.p1 TRINITY_DN2274_c0_g1~~TRINITY_DN2274_c0_g1_i8.p1  ORF type:complete len:617 (-),score=158.61 TRINITY_DN2274_c0_g1_i8:413-2263(-)
MVPGRLLLLAALAVLGVHGAWSEIAARDAAMTTGSHGLRSGWTEMAQETPEDPEDDTGGEPENGGLVAGSSEDEGEESEGEEGEGEEEEEDDAFKVFKLPESGHFTLWKFTAICAGIIVFTVLFEILNEGLHEHIKLKRGWKAVMAKIQDELMLLGVISFIFFFTQQALEDEDEWTVEHFELSHYVLFFIGISFSFHAVTIYSAMFHSALDRWRLCESAVHNPKDHFHALMDPETSGKDHTKAAQAKAEWVVVRSAYLDRFNLSSRFDYSEYLCQVSIDYLVEVMHSNWLAWLLTLLSIGLVVLAVWGVAKATSHDFLNTDDTSGMLRASTYGVIGGGWFMTFMYYLTYRWLHKTQRANLALLECGTDELVRAKLRDILDDSRGSDPWAEGWHCTKHGVNSGINLEITGALPRNITGLLSAYMLACNYYLSFMICIFLRVIYYAFDPGWMPVLYLALAAPYFICVLFLAPRCVALYTEIKAFRMKDDEVVLEQLEDMEYADTMAASVKNHLKSVHGDNAELQVAQVFSDLDKDGNGLVDHKEFERFMKRLDLGMSKEKLGKLIRIVDPGLSGDISREELMYWLFPEQHLRNSARLADHIKVDGGAYSKQDVPMYKE